MSERSSKLGTCCEMVAARDKKKEGEDMDVDDIRGGSTISCRKRTCWVVSDFGHTTLYKLILTSHRFT